MPGFAGGASSPDKLLGTEIAAKMDWWVNSGDTQGAAEVGWLRNVVVEFRFNA